MCWDIVKLLQTNADRLSYCTRAMFAGLTLETMHKPSLTTGVNNLP